MNTQSPQPKKPLKECLFERIESEQVCPRSRLFFHSRECFVWAAWFVSIVVGALAVAVSLFVMTHNQYEIYEATHNNFLTYMVEALPYLWIIVFGIMVLVAIYNLKHTKHGYRYPVWFILASSIVLSFAGGSALQLFGFGYTIDNVLGKQMSMYMSQEKAEQRLWQEPTAGRLIGKQVFSTLSPTSTIIFEDIGGQRWRMNVSELQARDIELLSSEQIVRILGEVNNSELHFFHACGASPWMARSGLTIEQMSKEKQAFMQRVYRHSEKAEERLVLVDGDIHIVSPPKEDSVCANLAAVKRMPKPAQ